MSELNESSSVVVVGAGQAGGEVVMGLRQQGYTGKLVLVGDEPHPPYKRPPLSKAYLSGASAREALFVYQLANLEKNNIEFIGNTAAKKIDRVSKHLELADGRRIPYTKLVLATGGRPRPLTIAGADKPNVFLLRSIADVDGIRAHSTAGQRVTIIGGGFIGLEVAAVLVKLGLKVTLLEGLPRVLARVTVPEMSAFFEKAHRDAGVDLRTGVQIAALDGADTVTQVRLADGSVIDTDFLVVGIGLIANTELAQEAGLAVDNGIVVDEFARTSDPDIYAAGDCTNHPSEFLGRRVRLESVQNAMEQGRAVAAILSGKNQAYQMVPWFWSDQYDLKLQMVGVNTGFDQMVIRGDMGKRSFAVFYLKDGRLLAADAVSRAPDFMMAKKLVALKLAVDVAQLADEAVPLKNFLPAA